MKTTTMMTKILSPQMAVIQTDYHPHRHQHSVHIAIPLWEFILLFWIITSINRYANRLHYRFFLLYVLNAKRDEELASTEEAAIIHQSRDNSTNIKRLFIVSNMLFILLSGMNKSPVTAQNFFPIILLLTSRILIITQF